MASPTPNLQGFSLKLFRSLSNGGDNVFFSPHSVASALMLIGLGARGDTFDQIINTLELENNKNVHEAFNALNSEILAAIKDGVEINIANKLYTRKGLEPLKSFVQELGEYYQGAIGSVDFIGGAEVAREKINKWVEKQTNEKIKDLLLPGMITSETEMVVVNAIYFKGLWEIPFKPEKTKEENFTVSSNEKFKVQMMKSTLQLQHLIDDNLDMEAVALPYQGRKLYLIVLLPSQTGGLSGLQSSLTPSKIHEVSTKLIDGRKYTVELSLPKFKMAVASEMKMALQKLGITDVFSDKMDLTGMFESKSKPITDVVHKAYIEVNDQGTEAAAATAMMSRHMLLPVENQVFRCDHPFMFFIVESSSKCVLFMGKLCRPE